MALFFISFFSVFALANYYVARRVWQGTEFLSRPARIALIVLFIISAASYPAARGLLSSLDNWFYDFILAAGSLHFVNLLYAFILVAMTDLSRVLFRAGIENLKTDPSKYIRVKGIVTLICGIVVMSLIVWGNLNSMDIRTKYADFTFPKKSGTGGTYKILLFSDSHFSSLNSGAFTKNLLQKIEKESPDIVLIAGDAVDDNLRVLNRHGFAKSLKNIKAPLGIYLCNGNHEYIVGIGEAKKFFDQSNIKTLNDTFVVINNSFIVAGRDDSSKSRFIGSDRKPLSRLLSPAKIYDLPILLLDHQPFNLAQSAREGIEFQFSGHTHNGQFFPISLITKLIYEISWGYKKIDKTHFYVSSGVGTWGPPVKIGSDSEIIVLNVSFR